MQRVKGIEKWFLGGWWLRIFTVYMCLLRVERTHRQRYECERGRDISMCMCVYLKKEKPIYIDYRGENRENDKKIKILKIEKPHFLTF